MLGLKLSHVMMLVKVGPGRLWKCNENIRTCSISLSYADVAVTLHA